MDITLENHYWLIPSTGKDIGGVSSQIKEMSRGYNLNADNSVWKIPILRKIDFNPNLNSFVLNYNSKLTDIIFDIGLLPSSGFLLTNKVKIILEKFNLPKHTFYPATIIHREKIYEYYWIQISEELSNFISYEKSTFDLKKNIGWQEWIDIEKCLKFNNVEELILKNKNKGSSFYNLIPEKLYMNKSYDLYSFNYFSNHLIINYEIKKALDYNGIKGFETICLNSDRSDI